VWYYLPLSEARYPVKEFWASLFYAEYRATPKENSEQLPTQGTSRKPSTFTPSSPELRKVMFSSGRIHLDRMISIGFTKPYNISPVFIFS
jgi:hypothetical protein